MTAREFVVGGPGIPGPRAMIIWRDGSVGRPVCREPTKCKELRRGRDDDSVGGTGQEAGGTADDRGRHSRASGTPKQVDRLQRGGLAGGWQVECGDGWRLSSYWGGGMYLCWFAAMVVVASRPMAGWVVGRVSAVGSWNTGDFVVVVYIQYCFDSIRGTSQREAHTLMQGPAPTERSTRAFCLAFYVNDEPFAVA
ncbi:hypothetical protein LX32DRAFT_655965 [Colletotrichum zoysiae]|uniref:Uncharacterized protein n=1 Tax=Colletotrichum zoysiae TaxID=1216348 RepID=A0AAD9HAX8_9PEZI|nr:hypothetical protein LX32DRAFT_655965 [Colletotrichum zoysiae]